MSRPHPRSDHRARPRGRHRLAIVAAIAVALALVASACSGDGSDEADRATTTTEPDGEATTTTTPDGGATTTEPPAGSPVQDGIRIEVLSSQPDRVTGPEARIRVTPAKDLALEDLQVLVGDVDVTASLRAVDGALEGVVIGFVEGTSTITARGGSESVLQRIRSWPLTGPMISGPHLPLLACSTEEHGLGLPTDANCSAPTAVSWRYISTDGTIKDLPDPSPDRLPADVARSSEKIAGQTEAPLVVRYEVGVVNRSVYEIATLDPSPGGADSDQDDATWNGRLLYRYGDGCGTTFGQGRSTVAALDPAYLRQGYAVATATFNSGAVQCNDVLSAETAMMVKERVIEEFGEPDLTIGEGTGMGAALLHLQQQNYPGLVDGAVALDPQPDIVTVASGIADCGLLERYYATPAGQALTPKQRTAINGAATEKTCTTWGQSTAGLFNPTDGCDPKIPAEQIYDATTNPGGVRCTLQDANVNQFGRSAVVPVAARPYDNVGLQYGLEAFNAGAITFDQFADLNEAIGGIDLDGAPQDERIAAIPEEVAAAYETGRVSSGTGDQRVAPTIDVDRYDDPTGSVNDRVRAFSLRDRYLRGGPASSVPSFQIWTRSSPDLEVGPEAVASIDRWLTKLNSSKTGASSRSGMLEARPADAVDNCTVPGRAEPIAGEKTYDEKGPCLAAFPIAGDPRIGAGAPRENAILKCELKLVDPSDYEVELTSAQVTRLSNIFPDGVCDWSASGVGQTSPSMADRTYEDAENPAGKA